MYIKSKNASNFHNLSGYDNQFCEFQFNRWILSVINLMDLRTCIKIFLQPEHDVGDLVTNSTFLAQKMCTVKYLKLVF